MKLSNRFWPISLLHRTRSRRSFIFATWLAAISVINLCNAENIDKPAKTNQENLKAPIVLQDLAYGNILFEYFRGKPIEALNQILVAKKRGQLFHHRQNAELLSGVIYLDIGMLSHAQKIFNTLLQEDELESGLFSKIEFYLGKLHYKQGDLQQAEFRLERVLPQLNSNLKDECLVILSNLAMQLNRLEQAETWLKQISIDSNLAAVSQFNLGMLYLKEQKIAQATSILNNIKLTQQSDEITKNVIDRANLALGYYNLSHQNYEQARKHLNKVRLNSLSANKALLGIGWSYAEQANFQRALSHWNALSKNDIRDVAVQEVQLAIPYALQKLGALQEALTNYQTAALNFEQQIKMIDDVLNKIKNEKIIEQFVINLVLESGQVDSNTQQFTLSDLQQLGNELDYYLFELVSEHRFNESFKSYLKLGELATLLEKWERELPTFDQIVKTNELRFEQKMPVINDYLKTGMVEKFQQELTQLERVIDNLKQDKNIHQLANSNQLEIYQRLTGLNAKLADIPDELLSNQQKEKARRANGVLRWQLLDGKVAKIWQLEKVALEIRETINQMSLRKQNLADARHVAQTRFQGYQQKIDEASKNLQGLQGKVDEQIKLQANALETQIVKVLNSRKKALQHYLLQSDLSIARLHEQALKLPELD
ncbi:hypothetical protein [Aliikangiella sp. IMCC44632]